MRIVLRLNTPWRETGNAQTWTFSGADTETLLACLDRIDGHSAANAADRWTAAVVVEFADRGRDEPKRAWTINGAMALAELLPETLEDLRDELLESFTARKSGWVGDAQDASA